MRDPYALMGMLAILPLLEAIDALVCFAQSRNVFICDFIAALERCRGQLFTLYGNESTKFKRDDFHSFNMLLQLNHESILLKWDANLNLPEEQLVFVFGDHEVPAMHKGRFVTREIFSDLVRDIKIQCSSALFKPLPVLGLLSCLFYFYFIFCWWRLFSVPGSTWTALRGLQSESRSSEFILFLFILAYLVSVFGPLSTGSDLGHSSLAVLFFFSFFLFFFF
jgi:hypothetical protein